MPDYPHPREFYRIPYPLSARPQLIIAGISYPVLDLSEGGLRYEFGEGPAPQLEEEVRGILKFKQGNALGVRGTIVRVGETQAAVSLGTSLPFKVILDEQRYLRDHFRGMAW